MKVDSHQHFWLYDLVQFDWLEEDGQKRDFLPPDLEPELLASGYDASVAVQARESLDENVFLLDLAARFPRIAGVVGWVDFHALDVQDQLAELASHPKAVGVRPITQGKPQGYLLESTFLSSVRKVEQFELAYDVLIYSNQMVEAAKFVGKFPSQRFVLDHLGKPRIRDGERSSWLGALRELAKCDNLWCKLSGLVTEASPHWQEEDLKFYADSALETFGPRRLMIGSDWPVCLSRGDYGRVMSVQEGLLGDLSESEKDCVLGRNAIEFYRLSVG
jgi:L-fuconolactonase